MKTITNLNELNNFIELLPDLVFIKDLEGKYTHTNQNFLSLLEKEREEVLNKTDFDIFNKKNAQAIRVTDQEILHTETEKEFDEIFLKQNNEILYLHTTKKVIYNEDHQKIGLLGVARNITQRKQYEIIYEDNKKVLENIAIENDLQKTLKEIVLLAQKRNPGVLGSILLLDKEKKHLFTGAGPSLPDFYNEAINGIKVGKDIGSCGAACYEQKRVIVDNIQTSTNWKPFLELANKAKFGACWSEPIFSSNNELLGTFAIYTHSPKAPNSFELKLISSYAYLASIAIDKDLNRKRLQESELLKNNILSTIPDMIWLKDVNGVYLACNPEFERFFGAKESEIIGKTDYDFVNKELADFFREHDKNAMYASEPLVNEEWITYATDQRRVLLDTTKKALKNKEGKIVGVLGIGHDVTHRKHREEKLKELKNLAEKLTQEQSSLLSLFDQGDSVLFKWNNDEKWTVDYVSASASKLLGYSEHHFLANAISYEHCIKEEDLERVKSEVNHALDNNLNYFKHEPYRIITSKGEEKWVLDYTISQKDSQNNITHFIGYITDITEQKKQQEMFFQQSKMVSMGEMIGNIAHQWRQPLSVISSCSTGLKLQSQLKKTTPEKIETNCEIINENAQFLSKTIDDFRNFINVKREKTLFNINQEIHSFLNLVNATIKNYDIKIILNLKENITFFGCPNELKQCLMNLFNNSKDALQTSNKENIILISTDFEEETIIIKFMDNNHGIEEEILPRIFEPYFTTKHQTQGTGLGLSMTYNLILEGMNGTIEVKNSEFIYEDTPYTGALFTIKIPLKHS